MKSLPSGTVTFLFTDIEGSTRLAREHPETWESARARHHAILHEAVRSNQGSVFQIIGDAFCAAFHKAGDALRAALESQHKLQDEAWGETVIRVRMGIHTGEAEAHGQEYHGYLALSLVQRLMSAGHGNQILVSNVTESLLYDQLPKDVNLLDMGERRLKDVPHSVRIFQVVAPGLQTEFPILKTQHVHPHNLPVQLTSFVGREKELAEIAMALAQNRLVTIIGSGGTGKTRLAIEAGAAQLTDQHFTHGVYFVPLVPLETTEAIVPATASSLGFSFYEGSEPRQQLLDYLREKSMLLIFDNFEHLLPGAGLVTEILSTAPHVKIIATSRARLNIQGEQLFHLSGMEFPNWESPQDASKYSAIKLFAETARHVCPDFELTTDNMRYIVRLCRLVEGMPLGILLAAAWLEMLTPEEIASEIEQSLDFLETRQGDLPDRQHSMRAVFDYSWKLLTPREQNVFMKSSVFRGGFTREAAQQVTGASLHDLMGLVDKSLLQRSPNGRYQIHELLRQYGAEKLSSLPNDSETARNQHSTYFAEYLHQREAALSGKEQKRALIDISTEIENIRAAWDWATLKGLVENINNSLESLAEYYDMRSEYRDALLMLSTAAERLAKYLAKSENTFIKLLLAKIQMRQGDFNTSLGNLHTAEQLLRASLKFFDETDAQEEKAYALYFLGRSITRWKEQEEVYEQALTIFKRVGNHQGMALCLGGLSDVTISTSEFEINIQYCRESLRIFQELGNNRWIASTLDDVGYAYWLVGDYQTARKYHQESIPLHKEIGNRRAESRALDNLAIVLAGLKEYDQAILLLQEALTICKEIGTELFVGILYTNLAEVFIAMGDFVNAVSHAKESFSYFHDKQAYLSWPCRTLGEALVGSGELQEAREYMYKSLYISHAQQEKMDILLAIKAISTYLIAKGDHSKALDLITLINHHPATWQWTKDRASELATKLESKLPRDVIARAKERGRARDLDVTVAELLEELKDVGE